MSCSRYNIKITAGDTLGRTFTFTDTNDDPIDISVYDEINMQVREEAGSVVVAEATLENGMFSVSGASNNVLTLNNLPMPSTPGKYKYDIEFVTATTRRTMIGGVILIKEQITKP